MKRIKLLLPLLVLILSLSFSFLIKSSVDASTVVEAPTTDEGKVDRALENIYIRDKAIASFPVTYKSGFGATITWTSSDNTVIDASKVNETAGWVIVYRSVEADKTADLTVTVSLNDITKSKTVTVTVPKGQTITNTYNVAYNFGELTDVVNENPNEHIAGQLVELKNPTKEGYQFIGWYTDAAYTNKITYLPVGAYQDITVYAKFAEIVLDSITVTGDVKTTYTALEEFDKTNMVVTATYSDGSTKVVTDAATVDKTALHGDDTKVTVSYTEKGVTKTADIAITVTKIALTAPIVNEKYTSTYDGTAHSVSLDAVENVTITYSENNTLTNVGTETVTINFAVTDERDYTIDTTTATTTLEVTPRAITVKANDYTKTYGEAMPETLEWAVTVGEIVATDTLEFTCTKAEGTNAGTYDITVSANAEYKNYAITLENGTYTINKAPLTITPTNVTVNRGAELPSTVNVTFTGFVNDETEEVLTGTIKPTFTVENTNTAGTSTFTISGYTSDNYEITYNEGTLTINESSVVITIPEEKLVATYDGNVHKIADADITFTENGSAVTISHTITYSKDGVEVENPTDAGTYNVLVSFNDATYGTGSHSFAFVINPKDVTITVESQTVTYNGSVQTLDQTKKTVTGLVNENDLGVITLTLAGDAINAGTYPISVTYTENANYNVTATEDATLTINKAATVITAENVVVDYDGASHSIVATINHTESEATYSDNNSQTNAGTYTVTITVAESDNYLAATKEATITINRKAVNVTISDQTTTYSGVEPIVDQTMYTATGVVDGDDLGITLTKDAGVVVDVYEINGTASNTNYEVTFTPGVYTIDKASLTVTVNNMTIQRGSVLPTEFAYEITGFVNGETEAVLTSVDALFAVVDASNVEISDTNTIGTYTIQIVCEITDDNYVLENSVDGTLTIEMTNTEKATADAEKINADLGTVLTGTISNIDPLPLTGENGSTIVWTANSDLVHIDSVTGEVTIDNVDNTPVEITLKATVKNGNEADPDGVAYSIPFTFTFDFTPKGTTAENPYSADEAIEIASALASGAFSDEAYYVSGVIVTEPTFNSSHNSYTFDIANSSTTDQTRASSAFTIYSASLGMDVEVPVKGMTVVVYGYFKNHNGTTPELAGDSTHTYPSIISSVFTDQAKLELDMASINLPASLSSNDTFLTTLEHGSTVRYTSKNPDVLSITDDGTVTIVQGEADITVTVSYFVTNGTAKSGELTADIIVKAKGSVVENKTITFDNTNITNFKNTYADYTGSVESINLMFMKCYKGTGSCIQGNSSKSSFIYNDTAIPGKIISISIEVQTSIKTLDIYAGTSVLSTKGSGDKVGNITSSTLTVEFDNTTNYNYFQIVYVGGASYVKSVTITYQPS